MTDSNDSDASLSSEPLKRVRSVSRSATPSKRSKLGRRSGNSSTSRSSTPLRARRRVIYSDDSDADSRASGVASDKDADVEHDMEEGEIDDDNSLATDLPPAVPEKDEDEYHDEDDDDDKEEGEIEEDDTKASSDLDPNGDADGGDHKASEVEEAPEVVTPRRSTPSRGTPGATRRGAPRGRRRGGPGRGGLASRNALHKAKQQAQPGSEHTTDQMNEEGDEYIVSAIDPAGEAKITPDGELLGGREFRIRTFRLPNRGTKYFMMATECAKELNFRDSYLLFNKNRSLYKLIATQSDKEALIDMGHLPYAYRSRQIALVSAKSMFRQFGSLVIVDGRRVKDDYWEKKAIDEGFTENDFAVEKKVVPLVSASAYSASTPSAQNEYAPSFQESILQGISRGDSIGQIVFGIRGAPQITDIPESRIRRLFRASSSTKTDPQDEPVRFVAAASKGTKSDTTSRATLDAMVEAASSAIEFNAFLSRKRVARQKMWKAFWTPKSTRKEPDTNGEVKDETSKDEFGSESVRLEPMIFQV